MSHVRTQVLVLNFRGRDYIRACLKSLLRSRKPPGGWKCVVIDNASDDGSVELVRRRFSRVDLIENKRNLGYAGGNNVGIRKAVDEGATYIALVNMDVQVHRSWLKELVEVADSNPDGALFGSRVLTTDKKTIEFDGKQFDPVSTSGGYANLDIGDSKETPYDAPYACGAALLLRVSSLREAGLFDPTFFAYHEDVDLALRCWLLNMRVLQVPSSLVYHARGGAGAGSTFRDYMGARNSLLTVLKVYDRATWNAHSIPLIGHFLPDADPARMKASLAAFHALPQVLGYRRRLMARAKHRYSEWVQSIS